MHTFAAHGFPNCTSLVVGPIGAVRTYGRTVSTCLSVVDVLLPVAYYRSVIHHACARAWVRDSLAATGRLHVLLYRASV